MIKEGLWTFHDKRVLLLQGPVGPFFNRLAVDLRGAGATVFKINFNGGDLLFYRRGATAFLGRKEEWPAFFESFVRAHRIDIVLLFGDCRPLHMQAHGICTALGVEVGVFEEGYIRPDYITFERFGVNGHSQMPRSPKVFRRMAIEEVAPPLPVVNPFWHAMVWAMLYNTAGSLMNWKFRHYEHHRTLTITEGLKWLRSFWRKGYYARREKAVEELLHGELSRRFFLVPLQVYNDAQIYKHSDYESVEQFIQAVIKSFSAEAPPDCWLVIKQHPLDRGFQDYRALILAAAEAGGIADRVIYIHDLSLPKLLKHTLGVVVINSTVGLSALLHRVPLKTCGKAIYDIEGLVFPGSLAEFWRDPKPCDPALQKQFYTFLLRHTQINGSFYRRLPVTCSHAGVRWNDRKGVV